MQEDVAATSKPARIQLKEPAAVGEFIRRTGADVCPGQILLTKGMACHAAHVGVLAAQGMTSISVGQRPRIGILTTGNEILLPGQSPSHEGQIHNSNAPALAALFHQQNLAASLTLAHAKDEMEAMQQAMTDLLEHADVLICVGGVSVGDHDLVKPALTALGVTTEFWRVAMKPGKPFLFGHQSGKYVFGLPGNPVSAFVTAFLLVLPALRKLSGAAHPEPQCTTVKLTHPMKNTDRRLTYFRGNWDRSKATFTPLGLQESHALYGLSQANALLPIPPESELAAHTMVEILPFG
jgi:molybdopterin molybdotransferase